MSNIGSKSKYRQCDICGEEYTSVNVEVVPGVKIYVCGACLEAAKHNFIWICMNCGKVYIRSKKLVINRIKDVGLKRAYLLCMDMRIIQGIDMCVRCDPEGVMNYMNVQKTVIC